MEEEKERKRRGREGGRRGEKSRKMMRYSLQPMVNSRRRSVVILSNKLCLSCGEWYGLISVQGHYKTVQIKDDEIFSSTNAYVLVSCHSGESLIHPSKGITHLMHRPC